MSRQSQASSERSAEKQEKNQRISFRRNFRVGCSGRAFYIWFLSILAILCIPLLMSLFLQKKAAALLQKELADSESSLLRTTGMVTDKSLLAMEHYASSLSEEPAIQNFISLKALSDGDSRLAVKRAFDTLRLQSDRPENIEDLYLFAPDTGYAISSRNGSCHESAGALDYQKEFGCERSDFWAQIRSCRTSSLLLGSPDGRKCPCYLRVVIGKGHTRPLGYLLVRWKIPEEVSPLSEENVISGICLDDGRVWDHVQGRLFNDDLSALLVKSPSFQTISFEGEEYLVTKFPSQLKNWAYVRASRTDSVYDSLYAYRKLYLLYFILCIFLCSFLAWILSMHNYNPVLRLTRSLRQPESPSEEFHDANFQWIWENYRRLVEDRTRLADQLDQERILIQNNLFSNLLKGYYKTSFEIDQAFTPCDIKFDQPNYRLILWSPDDCSHAFGEENADLNPYTLDLVRFIIKNIAEECTWKYAQAVWSIELSGLLFLLVGYTHGEEPADKLFRQVNHEIKQILRDEFDVGITWFLSREYYRADDLPAAYMECIHSMQSWNDPEAKNIEDRSAILEEKNRFLSFLSSSQFNNAAAAFNALAENFSRLHDSDNTRRLFLCSLLYEMEDLLQNDPEARKAFISPAYLVLSDIREPEVLKTQIENFIADLPRYRIDRQPEDRASGIMHYIEQNMYDAGLSLGQTADHFGMSASSVSKLVKKTYGIHLMNYVNVKRIEKACLLLENTELSLQDISEKTGFYSYRTMIRLFRQQKGMTPSEYRRQLRSKQACT